jgi:hypothetical protein
LMCVRVLCVYHVVVFVLSLRKSDSWNPLTWY